eukprot:scaffold12972_cov125-Skeletonema_marinoi.AAC.2
MSWRPTQMPHQATYDVVATSTFKTSLSRAKDVSILSWPTMMVVSDASSGHLRCCSNVDTFKMSLSRAKDVSILSWPTMMGH